jgi:hypothetical protein
MEMFKTEIFNPVTFTSDGVVDTEIPQLLVDALQKAFPFNFPVPDEGKEWTVTPLMTNPNKKEISVGVLVPELNGVKFKYIISIKTKDYWDDIFNRLKEAKKTAVTEET